MEVCFLFTSKKNIVGNLKVLKWRHTNISLIKKLWTTDEGGHKRNYHDKGA